MTYQPTRIQAIRMIEDLVKVLKNDGAKAARLAKDFARATGLPSQTLGDGGSRSTSGGDSTSAAALRIIDRGDDRYQDADAVLDRLMVKVALEAEVLRLYLLNLLAHAHPEETHEGAGLVRPTKAGEGECLGCGRQVPGTEDDRLRGGACSACAMAWTRHQRDNPQADRVMFMRNRPRHDEAQPPLEERAPDVVSLAGELAATGTSARVAEVTRWHHGETTDITEEVPDA
jgi:hypothetical protein